MSAPTENSSTIRRGAGGPLRVGPDGGWRTRAGSEALVAAYIRELAATSLTREQRLASPGMQESERQAPKSCEGRPRSAPPHIASRPSLAGLAAN